MIAILSIIILTLTFVLFLLATRVADIEKRIKKLEEK